jgi:general secretion pathway protein D
LISKLHRRLFATPSAASLRRWRLAFIAIAAGIVIASPAALAADEPVTLNFVNADIDAVIKAVAEITGRNFIVDPKVKGTINIISARPVPRSLVYPTLLSALRLQGFAAIEGDEVVKIVPEADAKQQAGTITTGRVTTGGDRLVTQVITLKYESAAQLVNVLRPLISPNNTIAAYPNGNALVITDYADNLKRLDRIISSLDQPPGGEPVLVPLRYASAIDIVPLINKLVADTVAAGAAGTPPDVQQRVTVIADPRSNAILLRADNPGRVARLRQLIEQLDTPGRPGGNMFIVYLRNADAARVAQTLRAMLTGSTEGGGGPAATGLSPQPATGMLGTPPAATAVPAATTVAAAPFTSSGSTTFAAGGATITADVANNALVIMAPEPIYNNLRAIIEKLDSRRAQVFVEALICEVSADKSAEFGIQWQALSGINSTQTRVIGGTNFTPRGSGNNIIDISANPGSVGQGLALGVTKGDHHDSRTRADHQPRVPRARARDAGQREHPVHADAAHARQRGGEDPRRPEHPDPHRQLCDDGQHDHGDAVPDVRAEGHRTHAAHQAADYRRRDGPAHRVPGSVAPRSHDQHQRRRPGDIEARARILGRDRR